MDDERGSADVASEKRRYGCGVGVGRVYAHFTSLESVCVYVHLYR